MTSVRDHGRLAKGQQNGECEACDRPATHWVRIAWDYMRGNDDSYNVCERHHGMAQNALRKMLFHCGTKKQFIARKAGVQA